MKRFYVFFSMMVLAASFLIAQAPQTPNSCPMGKGCSASNCCKDGCKMSCCTKACQMKDGKMTCSKDCCKDKTCSMKGGKGCCEGMGDQAQPKKG